MFEEAIRYPWKGEKKVETIAIGGVLTLLVLPVFLTWGYAVEVVRRVSAGEVDEPPAFEDWGALLVDGLKVFLITVVYSLIPAAVVAAAAFSFIVPASVSAGGDGSGALGAAGFLLGILALLVSLVASVALIYVVPTAVAAYARTDRLGAAFSPSELRFVGGNRAYATAWLVAVALTLLASVVSGAVSATFVGGLLVPFVTFYGMVASAYAIGEGIGDLPVVEESERTVVGEHTA